MKHLLTQTFISLTILFCAYINCFATESGWEQRTGYKYQKLHINDLVSLHLSPNSDSIFTYNKDGFLRIWDFESGILLDSVDFTDTVTHVKPNLFQFSTDGKTAVIAYFERDSTNLNSGFNYSKQRVLIYNIYYKKTLIKTDINLLELFPFDTFSGYELMTIVPSLSVIYDYISNKNELYVNTHIFMKRDESTISILLTTGYLGILEIDKDSIKLKKQICPNEVNDYLIYNDSSIIFSTNYSFYQGVQDRITQRTLYTIAKINFLNSSTKILFYQNDKDVVSDYKKISRILPTNMRDTILYKRYYSFYYYDNAANNISNNLLIPRPNLNSKNYVTLDCIFDTKDMLVQCQDSVFYFYNIQTTKRIDSIISPIGVDSFFIAKNNKSLIAYNSSGEIVVLNISHITSVNENNSPTTDNTISISPNPTSTSFTISGLQGKPSVSIVNSLGMEVSKQQANTPQVYFDAIGFANGIYFVQVKAATGMVSKMLVVYR